MALWVAFGRSRAIVRPLPGPSETLPVPVTQPTEPRAVVSWKGPSQPIVLTVYGPAGAVEVPLTPTRALALAVELTQRAVLTIKVNQWGKMLSNSFQFPPR